MSKNFLIKGFALLGASLMPLGCSVSNSISSMEVTGGGLIENKKPDKSELPMCGICYTRLRRHEV